MDVLLVAAKKDELTDTTQIAREAKLKPAVIDVDAGAQRDRTRVCRGSKNRCDLVVLSEVERFARSVKRRVGAGPDGALLGGRC